MERSNYIKKYLFDWEMLNVVVGGGSALDAKRFLGNLATDDSIEAFLKSYGIDPEDPVGRAELFGNFQEAVQFVKRFFLKEGNEEGLDYKIPNSILMITDVTDLLKIGIKRSNSDREERLWAEVILKVMHTILHVDKDLRSNYFSTIQTQIFDRFYKYIQRDETGKLSLSNSDGSVVVELEEFETKSKKTRESVIIKLLHKVENVAEELFDRVGVRFVTKTKLDTLRVIKFLLDENIVVPHNIKPSRSINWLIDLKQFKQLHYGALKDSLKHQMNEEEFVSTLNKILEKTKPPTANSIRNPNTLDDYRSIQFTCRQLINYRNPLFREITDLRKLARKSDSKQDPIIEKILNIDLSLLSRDIKFFYPYEIQIVDMKSHQMNSEGNASHLEYKKMQLKSAKERIFKGLKEFYNSRM
jgi:uncharacterized protein (TIGR04562 family)